MNAQFFKTLLNFSYIYNSLENLFNVVNHHNFINLVMIKYKRFNL